MVPANPFLRKTEITSQVKRALCSRHKSPPFDGIFYRPHQQRMTLGGLCFKNATIGSHRNMRHDSPKDSSLPGKRRIDNRLKVSELEFGMAREQSFGVDRARLVLLPSMLKLVAGQPTNVEFAFRRRSLPERVPKARHLCQPRKVPVLAEDIGRLVVMVVHIILG